MTERVLIIRTVSVEEMGPVFEVCQQRWPSAALCVLTSPNRRTELEGCAGVNEVLDYTSAVGGFGAPWTDGRPYTAVVVPVRNGSGCGYANVWRAISGVSGSSFWIVQWGRVLEEVGLTRTVVRSRVEQGVRHACGVPARMLSRLFLTHSRRKEQTP